jgi:capsular exopolysaccharide synthesis family protein
VDLERVLAILRRRWWIIAMFTVIVGGVSFGLSARQRKQYTATVPVVFQDDQQVQQEASGLQAQQSQLGQYPAVMATNVQLLTSQSGVPRATARIVGHGLTAARVANSIHVSQEGTTDVAEVSATSGSPSLAAATANTYAAQFIARQTRQQRASARQGLALVQHQIAAMSPQQRAGVDGQALIDRAESLRILAKLQNGGAQIVHRATVPSSPSSPKIKRNTALGIIFGLLLGLGAALLLERLDRRIKDIKELEVAYRLPLLAAVPRRKSFAKPPQLDSVDGRNDAEVFKLLRAYLRYFNVDRELRVLLVASASPGDGKSTIARNLAEAAQETGTKTLLLEADLRRPGLARHYGLPSSPGLAELLTGHLTVQEAIRSVPVAARLNGARSEISMGVLVAGQTPPNPAELIASTAMSEHLRWAAAHYELVVIDTPPVSIVSDAMPLLQEVDGVIVVSHLGRNTRDAAASLRDRLVGVSAPLLGVVANGVKSKSGDDYRYGYYPSGESQRPEEPIRLSATRQS